MPPPPLSPSIIALLLANMVPLAGVILWNWSILEIVLAFWAENVIIGVINNIKFITLATLGRKPSALAAIPFFTVHYGLFTLVHGAFIFAFLGDGTHFEKATIADGDMIYLGSLFLPGGVLFIPALSLFASHFFSYLVNFIGHREYTGITPEILMFQPYGRIIVLHLTVLLGGLMVETLGAPVFALILLILLKIAMDLAAHAREHDKKS